jgi:uncharacterized protein (TIGR03083 family)
VEYAAYCEAIGREGRALHAAAAAAGVEAAVPSCPEWRIADLLAHVGRLHRWIAAIVEGDGEHPSDHWSDAEPPPEAERLAWFADGVELIADVLLGAEPSTPAWSWTTDNTAGFWARRQANETAVHRWDAQLAAGAAQPIERELAVDGVDEFFYLLPYWRGASSLPVSGETMHLHATDGEGEWLVRLGADGLVITREHAKGDVALRAPASHLLLFLWGRADPSAADVFGDASILDRWQELVRW